MSIQISSEKTFKITINDCVHELSQTEATELYNSLRIHLGLNTLPRPLTEKDQWAPYKNTPTFPMQPHSPDWPLQPHVPDYPMPPYNPVPIWCSTEEADKNKIGHVVLPSTCCNHEQAYIDER